MYRLEYRKYVTCTRGRAKNELEANKFEEKMTCVDFMTKTHSKKKHLASNVCRLKTQLV